MHKKKLNTIKYVRRRKDIQTVDSMAAKLGTNISFDLSKHSDWKKFKHYGRVYGTYNDVDFYCTPYFDEGYIDCEIDSDTYWEIKGYVLMFYVTSFIKKRRDDVLAERKKNEPKKKRKYI